MTDSELIDTTIRTNLRIVSSLNRNPELMGTKFNKELLLRGIGILRRKGTLSCIERANLMRFNDIYSIENLR